MSFLEKLASVYPKIHEGDRVEITGVLSEDRQVRETLQQRIHKGTDRSSGRWED